MSRLLASLCLLVLVTPILADDRTDQLRKYVAESQLIVVGQLEIPPQETAQKEAGLHHYFCTFTVRTLLKGTVGKQNGLQVLVTRTDRELKADTTVPLEQGKEYLLFLAGENNSTWKPVALLHQDAEATKTVSRLADEEHSTAVTKFQGRKLGTLRGRFVYDGEPPVPAPLSIPDFRTDLQGKKYADSDAGRLGKFKPIDQSLLVGADGGVQNILIWITDKSIPVPPLPLNKKLPQPAMVTFKEGRFQPHMLAWWAAERPVRFQNDDVAPMNFHWSGFDANFNFLVKPADGVDRVVEAERLPTPVKCDIYSWVQSAYLFPCAHPYFAVTDAEGYFTIANIPYGEWQFRAWHERCGYLRTGSAPQGFFKMSIGATQVEMSSIKLVPAVFERDPPKSAGKKADQKDAKPGWRDQAADRRKANEPANAAELAGRWRMTLPAGFRHGVVLKKTADGYLKMEAGSKLNLLGTFAFTQKQLLLIETDNDAVKDYVWQLNDEGKFVLITDKQGTGGSYVGAVLEKITPRD